MRILQRLALKYSQTGEGIFYSNKPHQLLDKLELLGGSILVGNNGVIPEFSQIAHLLNKMKALSKKKTTKRFTKKIPSIMQLLNKNGRNSYPHFLDKYSKREEQVDLAILQ